MINSIQISLLDKVEHDCTGFKYTCLVKTFTCNVVFTLWCFYFQTIRAPFSLEHVQTILRYNSHLKRFRRYAYLLFNLQVQWLLYIFLIKSFHSVLSSKHQQPQAVIFLPNIIFYFCCLVFVVCVLQFVLRWCHLVFS